MKEFKGKVAVITGAANGFGQEFAKEAAQRQMKLVICDIDKEGLKRTSEILDQMKADYLALEMDVTIYENVLLLAEKTMASYGQVDLLFNNAGVVVAGPLWETPVKDMDYIIQSNLYSVAYGLKVFIPLMEKQNTPCHIVNTASVAGLMTSTMMPLYYSTKFANVALSESTYYQLQEKNSKIKMSIYCPGFVQTDLHNCDDRRPERFAIDDDPYYSSFGYNQYNEVKKHLIETGIPIDSVRTTVFEAIEDEKFYILTHPNYLPLIGLRVKYIMDGKNPDVAIFKR